MRREIWVTVRREGFHNYPEAPDEVAFLRSEHRHLFHIKVGFLVTHDNRDREFFLEQRHLNAVLDARTDVTMRGGPMHAAGSCESICQYLLTNIKHARWAEVSEDGENGARVER